MDPETPKENFLVTGSSGFIGSRLVTFLRNQRYKVLGVDIRKAPTTDYFIDISTFGSREDLACILQVEKITHVVHLAGLIQVGEGEFHPTEYWSANVGGTRNIIWAAEAAEVNKLIFASSAAVYKSSDEPLVEGSPLGPVSVYGKTKLTAEKLLVSNSKVESVIFRFFNVGGGKEENPCHLIPILLERCSWGNILRVFGGKYSTPDGTCIRDYFHVQDLISAIILAVERWDAIHKNHKHQIYNLGTGKGISVLEICEEVTQAWQKINPQEVKVQITEPRAGDPPFLVANFNKAHKELGWKPKKSVKDIINQTLEEMIPSTNS